MERKDYFENLFFTQPGRNGFPLKYVIRNNQNPIVRANAEFLDDDVYQYPLNGDDYTYDVNEVHTVNFITGNPTAEKKSHHNRILMMGGRIINPSITIMKV